MVDAQDRASGRASARAALLVKTITIDILLGRCPYKELKDQTANQVCANVCKGGAQISLRPPI